MASNVLPFLALFPETCSQITFYLFTLFFPLPPGLPPSLSLPFSLSLCLTHTQTHIHFLAIILAFLAFPSLCDFAHLLSFSLCLPSSPDGPNSCLKIFPGPLDWKLYKGTDVSCLAHHRFPAQSLAPCRHAMHVCYNELSQCFQTFSRTVFHVPPEISTHLKHDNFYSMP